MKKLSYFLSIILVFGLLMTACSEQDASQKTMQKQNEAKTKQAAKMMNEVKTPSFSVSLERQNIRDRLIKTNDPAMLQWIYLFSAGRTIGRFPVRGKVTSGSKRLTSTQMEVKVEGDNSGEQGTLGEAPDEMGTYGSSGNYIFWFDPAGNYHQWQGDYFLSPVPYKIDKGNGTITLEIDQSEQSKTGDYNNQIKQSLKGAK